jgi:hypothetical protein
MVVHDEHVAIVHRKLQFVVGALDSLDGAALQVFEVTIELVA